MGKADLDDDEAGARAVGGFEVDAGLVMRDVEALDRGALLKGGSECALDGEEAREECVFHGV